MSFTMRQYNKVWEETQRLMKIESGEEEPQEPMGGKLGAAAASKLLPRKDAVYGE